MPRQEATFDPEAPIVVCPRLIAQARIFQHCAFQSCAGLVGSWNANCGVFLPAQDALASFDPLPLPARPRALPARVADGPSRVESVPSGERRDSVASE